MADWSLADTSKIAAPQTVNLGQILQQTAATQALRANTQATLAQLANQPVKDQMEQQKFQMEQEKFNLDKEVAQQNLSSKRFELQDSIQRKLSPSVFGVLNAPDESTASKNYQSLISNAKMMGIDPNQYGFPEQYNPSVKESLANLAIGWGGNAARSGTAVGGSGGKGPDINAVTRVDGAKAPNGMVFVDPMNPNSGVKPIPGSKEGLINPGEAARISTAKIAASELDSAKNILVDKNGKVNRVALWTSGVPFSEGKDAHEILERAAFARAQMVSPRGASPDALEMQKNMFLPNRDDGDAEIVRKLDNLKDFFNQVQASADPNSAGEGVNVSSSDVAAFKSANPQFKDVDDTTVRAFINKRKGADAVQKQASNNFFVNSAQAAEFPNGQKAALSNVLKPVEADQKDNPFVKPSTPFKLAEQFVGANERQNKEILGKFFKNSIGNQVNPQDVPWCAAFVNGVLQSSGQKGTNSLAARSFLQYGEETTKPKIGDLVVLSRGPDPSKGHVGFYAGKDENGNVKVLGGNQDDSVSVKSFPLRNVLGFRNVDNIKEQTEGSSQYQPTGLGAFAPPSVAAPTRIGFISAKHESNNNPATVARDTAGTMSYGLYQFNTKGMLPGFLASTPYGAAFKGLRPGTPAFNQQWQSIAARDPNFGAAQTNYVEDTILKPLVEKASTYGLPTDSKVMKEAILSTGVQHGRAPVILAKAASLYKKGIEPLKALYQARGEYVSKLGSISSKVKKEQLKRYAKEYIELSQIR